MKATREGLEIAYLLSKGNRRMFRLNFGKFDGRELTGRLRLMSSPQNGEGLYVVEVDPLFSKALGSESMLPGGSHTMNAGVKRETYPRKSSVTCLSSLGNGKRSRITPARHFGGRTNPEN
jgi:hypothetical protein